MAAGTTTGQVAAGEPAVLSVRELRFAWPGSPADVLDIAGFDVAAGETVFLHGPSGCGKSSLLALLAGVLLPRQGQVRLAGRDWQAMGRAARDRWRVDHVGYIFQQFNLLPYLSVRDNVLLPCRFSAGRRDAASARGGSPQAEAERWLAAVGLAPALWRRTPGTLSVGQQQRVAAARALIGAPALVIADEPTSALDEDLRNAFVDLLLTACQETRSALVFVSHDRRIAPRFARQLALPELNRAKAPAAA
jgi:putative ABC transport system ATP-binding protein